MVCDCIMNFLNLQINIFMHHIYKIMIKTSILSINVKHNINISNYTQLLQI
jgi:hypothetical protein